MVACTVVVDRLTTAAAGGVCALALWVATVVAKPAPTTAAMLTSQVFREILMRGSVSPWCRLRD